MGVIRGFFVFVVSLLLTLSAFSAVLLLTATNVLDYNNVQTQASAIAETYLQENPDIQSLVDTNYVFIQMYCNQGNADYLLNFGEYEFKISCEKALQGKELIIPSMVETFISGVYYKEYECDFINCFKEVQGLPLFVLSEKSHNFWKSTFYWSLLISFAFLLMLFFLVKKKTTLPIVAGSIFLSVAIPFMLLKPMLQKLLTEPLAIQIGNIFVSKIYSISLWLLIFSIVLIIGGILLKIFKVGAKEENTEKKKEKKEDKKVKVKKK